MKDREAAISNLKLVLSSDKRTLLGDPFFGTELKKYLFEQNDSLIPDIIVDQIYSAIVTYVPQIILERKNIVIKQDKTKVYAEVTYKYISDEETNLLYIMLTEE